MTGEVNEMIQALRDGRMSLEEVALRFRERSWPRTRPAEPQSDLEWATSRLRDPEPDVPDSFDDVIGAYDRGEITRQQYRVLADAVAEAKRAQHDPNR